MSKTASIGALWLAVAASCHAAQAQTAIPPAPKDFLMTAAQSDQYEILSAHLALVQAQDPRIRTIAEAMIRDHTRMNGDLRQAAAAAGLPAPDAGMSSDDAAALGGLQGQRGADFDKAYARQQELAHARALAVDDSFATAGADADLRKAAQAALPAIQDHLAMAKRLRAEIASN